MTASHGRLPWFEPDQLTPGQRATYEKILGGPRGHGPQAFPLTDERGRLHGPFNALLVDPELGDAMQALGGRLRFAGNLSPRAREIAILEVAALRRSDFEWYAHERVGRGVGLSEGELAALRDGSPAPTLEPDEQLVRAVARMLVRERGLDDATADEAQRRLGTATLMQLLVLTGYYDLVALLLRTWQVPLPIGETSAFADPVNDPR